MAADEVAALAEVARQFDGSADPMAIRTASEARAGEGNEMRDLTTREALLGTSFTLTGEPDPDNGGVLAFWGRVAQSRFEGQDGALKLDGDLTTGLLGADYGRNGWLAGLMLSRSSAKGGYDSSDGSGALESTLTAATAYGALAMSPRLTLWGAAGLGSGDLTLTPTGGDAAEAGLDWRLAALGLRSSLIELPAAGGLGLALVSDALWTQTASDQTTGLSASKADVTRLRLGLEGSWAVRLQGGGSLTPRLELGLRHDDGDAETWPGGGTGRRHCLDPARHRPHPRPDGPRAAGPRCGRSGRPRLLGGSGLRSAAGNGARVVAQPAPGRWRIVGRVVSRRCSPPRRRAVSATGRRVRPGVVWRWKRRGACRSLAAASRAVRTWATDSRTMGATTASAGAWRRRVRGRRNCPWA